MKSKRFVIYSNHVPVNTPPRFLQNYVRKLSHVFDLLYFPARGYENNSLLDLLKNIMSFLRILLFSASSYSLWRFSKLPFLGKSRTNQLYNSIFKLIFKAAVRIKNQQVIVISTYLNDHIFQMSDGVVLGFDCIDEVEEGDFERYKEVLIKCDFILTNTKYQYEKLKKYNKKVHLISAGYLEDNICFSVDAKEKMKNAVVYSGGISSRIDYNLLDYTTSKLKEINFVFLGEQYLGKYYVNNKKGDVKLACRWANIKKKSNVYYLGYFDEKTTFEILSMFEVGIIPYRSSIFFNRQSNPIKYYEYLSAGLSVVTTPNAATYKVNSNYPVIVARNKVDFVKGIKIQLIKSTRLSINTRKRIYKGASIKQKIKDIQQILENHHSD